MSDDSSDEEDYAYDDVHQRIIEKRFPLHDCCEFEDVEALRVRLETTEIDGWRLGGVG